MYQQALLCLVQKCDVNGWANGTVLYTECLRSLPAAPFRPRYLCCSTKGFFQKWRLNVRKWRTYVVRQRADVAEVVMWMNSYAVALRRGGDRVRVPPSLPSVWLPSRPFPPRRSPHPNPNSSRWTHSLELSAHCPAASKHSHCIVH